MFVCERMAKKLITVQPDTKLSDVSQLMTQHNIRHLPVVNGEGLLVVESGLKAVHDQDPWPKPAPKSGSRPAPRTPPVPRSTLVKPPARHRGNNR